MSSSISTVERCGFFLVSNETDIGPRWKRGPLEGKIKSVSCDAMSREFCKRSGVSTVRSSFKQALIVVEGYLWLTTRFKAYLVRMTRAALKP